MVQVSDLVVQFFYWLCPSLKKERDLALEKVQHYAQRVDQTEQFAKGLAIENERLKKELEARKQPEARAMLRPKTAAEVRRLMQRETLKQGEDNGI